MNVRFTKFSQNVLNKRYNDIQKNHVHQYLFFEKSIWFLKVGNNIFNYFSKILVLIYLSILRIKINTKNIYTKNNTNFCFTSTNRPWSY